MTQPSSLSSYNPRQLISIRARVNFYIPELGTDTDEILQNCIYKSGALDASREQMLHCPELCDYLLHHMPKSQTFKITSSEGIPLSQEQIIINAKQSQGIKLIWNRVLQQLPPSPQSKTHSLIQPPLPKMPTHSAARKPPKLNNIHFNPRLAYHNKPLSSGTKLYNQYKQACKNPRDSILSHSSREIGSTKSPISEDLIEI